MEKEKLIIKNFGPIKSVELDLGRFNILIGEQATGKSTVAKVLAVCRYFSYIYENWTGEVLRYDDSPFYEGLLVWGLQEYVRSNTEIKYECKDYAFEAKYDVIEIDDWISTSPDGDGEVITRDAFMFEQKVIPLSIKFKNLLSELSKLRNEDNNFVFNGGRIPMNFFKTDVKAVMDNPFYLPTERGLQSVFSLGQSGIANLDNFLFNYFSKIDGALQSFKTETEIEPLSIRYINENGRGYIKKEGEKKFFSLKNAASGYQSTIPIVLVIKYQNEFRKRKKTFIIEEPELNLFPSAQDKLMKYLVENTISKNNSIFLTTHSPYVLTAINNMMFAHQVGAIAHDKTASILEERYWLNPDYVSAYRLNADGGYENLMDGEIKQIKAERIDEISRDFNKDYDAMLDIKYAKQHEG